MDIDTENLIAILLTPPSFANIRIKRKQDMTNIEHIRQMNIEELADIFKNLCCPHKLGGKVECNSDGKGCKSCWVNFLNKEL